MQFPFFAHTPTHNHLITSPDYIHRLVPYTPKHLLNEQRPYDSRTIRTYRIPTLILNITLEPTHTHS